MYVIRTVKGKLYLTGEVFGPDNCPRIGLKAFASPTQASDAARKLLKTMGRQYKDPDGLEVVAYHEIEIIPVS